MGLKDADGMETVQTLIRLLLKEQSDGDLHVCSELSVPKLRFAWHVVHSVMTICVYSFFPL